MLNFVNLRSTYGEMESGIAGSSGLDTDTRQDYKITADSEPLHRYLHRYIYTDIYTDISTQISTHIYLHRYIYTDISTQISKQIYTASRDIM